VGNVSKMMFSSDLRYAGRLDLFFCRQFTLWISFGLVKELEILHKWSLVSTIKGIVHFEMNLWYALSYLKCIQDVGVFVSTVVSILIFDWFNDLLTRKCKYTLMEVQVIWRHGRFVAMVIRGKNDINTVPFLTQTACFVS